jgi:hypothetical protein
MTATLLPVEQASALPRPGGPTSGTAGYYNETCGRLQPSRQNFVEASVAPPPENPIQEGHRTAL